MDTQASLVHLNKAKRRPIDVPGTKFTRNFDVHQTKASEMNINWITVIDEDAKLITELFLIPYATKPLRLMPSS